MRPIPRLTFSFLEWFEKQNTKEFNLVEFGAGDSTIYFSNYFKKVTSYEDDLTYFDKIKNLNIPNVEIILFNFENIGNLKFKQSIQEAHIILIDNNPGNISREVVAKNLIDVYNYRNILILDNGNLNYRAYLYLKKNYKIVYNFLGRNYEDPETVTTVFVDRK
jgi:hypothetical protein